MNMQEIERALRELRLSGIAATLSTRVMQAQSTQEPFLDTFAAMLQDELDRRRSRLTERRFKQSRLDERPSLNDFDWRRFQLEYRDYIDLAKLAQLIPVIGAPVGAVVNYRLVDQLGRTATNAYRMRVFDQALPKPLVVVS